MRLQLAAMALSLAVLSRQMQTRSVAAFTIRTSSLSSPHIRSITTSSTSSPGNNVDISAHRRTRRVRPKISSDSLAALIDERKRQGIPLHLSAVETENGVATETGDNGGSSDDISGLFPQMGKTIEDCAPRMRFAPSPTGR